VVRFRLNVDWISPTCSWRITAAMISQILAQRRGYGLQTRFRELRMEPSLPVAANRVVGRLAATYLALAAVAVCWLIIFRGFDPDEFEHLQACWLLSLGEVPYRDFFEHHTPAYCMLMRPLLTAWGDINPEIQLRLPFLFRFCNAVLSGAVLAWTFRLARQLRDVQAAAFAVLLLVGNSFFLAKGIEIRPDPLAALGLVFCSSMLISAFGIERKLAKVWWRLALAGAGLALAVMSTQKALFAIPGIGAALLMLGSRRYGVPGTVYTAALIASGALVVTGPIVAFFVLHDALPEFLRRTSLGMHTGHAVSSKPRT
jgi:hypothetical protein